MTVSLSSTLFLTRAWRGLKSNRRKLLVAAVVGSLVVWLASSALVDWIFTRRGGQRGFEPPITTCANVEGHRLKTSDGQEIGASLIRGDSQQGCILLLHGNGGSRGQMSQVMRWLAEAKFTVLAITLRGHGDSTGEVNDLGWSARHDVVAAVALLQQEFPRERIFVVGRSLGAAAAIFAAGELKENVAGYFLEQPYKDLKSALWNRLQARLPAGLDWLAYSGMRLWAPVFLPVDPDKISPFAHIEDIPESVPIVFVTGSADRHARLDDVTALFRRVQSHAKLVVFDRARHEALDSNNPQLYRASLLQLLAAYPRESDDIRKREHGDIH